MTETDLWQMTALTFVPALFALVLVFIPSTAKDLLRWVTLLGTAVTLAVSLVVFVGYYQDVLEGTPSERGVLPLFGKNASLEARADYAAAGGDVHEAPGGRGAGMRPQPSSDYVARQPWIPRFNIEYFLGVDGISMPLVLLTTLISFLAMLASFPPRGVEPPHHGHGGQAHKKEPHWSERHVRGYCALVLLLETGMIGTFLALDFF